MQSLKELSDKINTIVSQISHAEKFLDRLSAKAGSVVAIFGGSIRDIVSFGKIENDLDILIYGVDKDGYFDFVKNAASGMNAEFIDYPGSHIVITLPGSKITFDIHYPKSSVLESLVRSDFTVNGIGYLWKEKQITDPLGGVEDLLNKKLRIHSPQYIVTDAPTFSRMFRTAAKLEFEFDKETTDTIRRFCGLISLHSGKTNIRTLYEFLKFLSMPKISVYLKHACDFGVIEGLFPELAIPSTIIMSGCSLLQRNIKLACSIDSLKATDQILNLLESEAGPGYTHFGLLRLSLFFFELGPAYMAYKPEAPYVKALSENQSLNFENRIEKNLLSFIASRYHEAAQLESYFMELIEVMKLVRLNLNMQPEPSVNLSLPMQTQYKIITSLIRTFSKI